VSFDEFNDHSRVAGKPVEADGHAFSAVKPKLAGNIVFLVDVLESAALFSLRVSRKDENCVRHVLRT